jgi:ectoine hydroxylase-related dioxygenase (phytanoyl-CoA dioxygenase family)
MRLTKEQLASYEEQGFIFIPNCFSADEVRIMKNELPAIFAEDSPRRVVEKDSKIVRSVYGSHSTNKIFGYLARHPRLVEPAIQVLGGQSYIHQFKINAKAAFGGDLWEWHQDYIFWRNEDGIQTDQLVNVVVFLDEVNEFNGPMIFIPGSHKVGAIDVAAQTPAFANGEAANNPYANSPAWISNLTADLKYSLERETIAHFVAQHGIVAPKGPAGSVLFFHSNLMHSSAANMSPYDRTIAIMTYNSVENKPHPVANPRPDFLVARDYTPVVPLSDDIFLTEVLA